MKQTIESNIVLKDIKPENIMVGQPIQPDEAADIFSSKLRFYFIDFGLSKQFSDSCTTEECKLAGTPFYVCFCKYKFNTQVILLWC